MYVVAMAEDAQLWINCLDYLPLQAQRILSQLRRLDSQQVLLQRQMLMKSSANDLSVLKFALLRIQLIQQQKLVKVHELQELIDSEKEKQKAFKSASGYGSRSGNSNLLEGGEPLVRTRGQQAAAAIAAGSNHSIQPPNRIVDNFCAPSSNSNVPEFSSTTLIKNVSQQQSNKHAGRTPLAKRKMQSAASSAQTINDNNFHSQGELAESGKSKSSGRNIRSDETNGLQSDVCDNLSMIAKRSKRMPKPNKRRINNNNSFVKEKHQNQESQQQQEDQEQSVLSAVMQADEPTYCLCQQVSYGEMIGCDNNNCTIEWFHFGCVGLTVKPKGKWYCPGCRGDKPSQMKSIAK